jgi:hypothetical protein
MSVDSLLAQHRGHRGSGGSSSSTGVSQPESPESKEFQRAAAIQARPEQVTEFQQLIKSDQAAQKSAQDLLQVAETASQVDVFQSTESLGRAVEEAQSDNEQFLLSLSNPQKSGLKDFTKKLQKANSDVTKEDKALAHELERSNIDGKQITEVATKLDKAIRALRAKQIAVGSEMGVQGVENSP